MSAENVGDAGVENVEMSEAPQPATSHVEVLEVAGSQITEQVASGSATDARTATGEVEPGEAAVGDTAEAPGDGHEQEIVPYV